MVNIELTIVIEQLVNGAINPAGGAVHPDIHRKGPQPMRLT